MGNSPANLSAHTLYAQTNIAADRQGKAGPLDPVRSAAGIFPHLDSSGVARMVDITGKQVSARKAQAYGFVRCSPSIVAALRQENVPKGDALAVARIAGIAGVKKTSELIALAHPIGIQHCQVDLQLVSDGIQILTTVETVERTGIEMEALTALQITALNLIDMLKAVDRDLELCCAEIVFKSGGRSGTWSRQLPDRPSAIVILAGGEGKRLGECSKADLKVGGKRLLDRILEDLPPVPTVVVGHPEIKLPVGIGLVMEEPAGSGPAAGLLAGWHYLQQQAVWSDLSAITVGLLPVDAPMASGALRSLMHCWKQLGSEHPQVLLGRAKGITQNVLGIFSADCLASIDPASLRNRSMRSFLSELYVETCPLPEKLVFDIDTPQDLATAKQFIADSRS